MTEPSHDMFGVQQPEDVGAARRRCASLAKGMGAAEAAAEACAIAATELGTNILRHGGGNGHLLVRAFFDRGAPALEIIAADRGPGIADVPAAASGSAPSGAGLGVGLGGVTRLADFFDAYSRLRQGTVILARFYFGGVPAQNGFLRWGGVSSPLSPREENGDGWTVIENEDQVCLLLVDGLGHGSAAKAASDAALESFGKAYRGDAIEWLALAHQSMRGTRGGVCALARVGERRVDFVGIGNVQGRVFTRERSHALISSPGTMGAQLRVPTTTVVTTPWQPGATMILWSDGLRSHVDVDEYPGLCGHAPSVVAAVLHRDKRRGTDDATVVVVSDTREGE